MGTEIAKIDDKMLRKAAERADSVGDLDGKLDKDEMSVFAQVAYTSGCSVSDITKYTGTETEDERLSSILDKMNEIEAKKLELANVRNELACREGYYDLANKESHEFGNIVKGVTGLLGGGIGVGALFGEAAIHGAIEKKFMNKYFALKDAKASANLVDKAFDKYDGIRKFGDILFGKTKAGGYIRLGLMAVAGIVGGIFAGKALAEKTNVFGLKPHCVKVSEKQSTDYEAQTIAPLEKQVKKLEKEIKDMENAFYAM